MARTVGSQVGYGRSEELTFTIGNGANGSLVTAVDLGRNYTGILIKCESTANIAAATTLSAKVGYGDSDPLVDLWAPGGSAKWVSGTLPTGANTFGFFLEGGIGVQRIQLILSNNATGDVVFKIYGIDPSVDD